MTGCGLANRIRPAIRIATSYTPSYRCFSSNSNISSSCQVPKIVLYQYSICPFCHRVRSFLDYQNLPYETKEVNPLNKSEIKQFKDQYKKVPIAEINGVPMFGSDQIIQKLLAQNKNHGFQNCDESKDPWVDFAVNKLAVLLYPNMCRTMGDSFRAFDYVNHIPSFGRLQRILIQSIGSLAMYIAASRVKKKHNIVDESKALQETMKVLEDHLTDNLFLSKSPCKPDLGDLAVYGTLRAIEGLPLHNQIVLADHQAIASWYQRMKDLTPSCRQKNVKKSP